MGSSYKTLVALQHIAAISVAGAAASDITYSTSICSLAWKITSKLSS